MSARAAAFAAERRPLLPTARAPALKAWPPAAPRPPVRCHVSWRALESCERTAMLGPSRSGGWFDLGMVSSTQGDSNLATVSAASLHIQAGQRDVGQIILRRGSAGKLLVGPNSRRDGSGSRRQRQRFGQSDGIWVNGTYPPRDADRLPKFGPLGTARRSGWRVALTRISCSPGW